MPNTARQKARTMPKVNEPDVTAKDFIIGKLHEEKRRLRVVRPELADRVLAGSAASAEIAVLAAEFEVARAAERARDVNRTDEEAKAADER